jgi:hypothetical protein
MNRFIWLAVLTIGGCATTTSSSGQPMASFSPGPTANGEVTPAMVAETPAGVSFQGGDGLSCETRVLVRGATGEQQGIAAEYAWLRSRYPGYKLKAQSLTDCQKAAVDRMDITTAQGKEVTVNFDISDFFGKGF